MPGWTYWAVWVLFIVTVIWLSGPYKTKKTAATTSESYHERACREYRDRTLGDWDTRVDWERYGDDIHAILRSSPSDVRLLLSHVPTVSAAWGTNRTTKSSPGAEACDAAWRAYRGAAVLSGPAGGNVWGERGTTAAEWMTVNPVLGRREHGVECDTGMGKIGDGGRRWNDLPYVRVMV